MRVLLLYALLIISNNLTLERKSTTHKSVSTQTDTYDSMQIPNECFICLQPITHNQPLALFGCHDIRHCVHRDCTTGIRESRCPLCRVAEEHSNRIPSTKDFNYGQIRRLARLQSIEQIGTGLALIMAILLITLKT